MLFRRARVTIAQLRNYIVICVAYCELGSFRPCRTATALCEDAAWTSNPQRTRLVATVGRRERDRPASWSTQYGDGVTPIRILVVEDDAVISALVADLLAALGHDVCGTARTEAAAIDAAVRHRPDLIIIDANLRTGSGVSAMAAILHRTAMPHIFMTAGTRLNTSPGATVLNKPFGTAELTAALDRVASQIAAYRARNESAASPAL